MGRTIAFQPVPMAELSAAGQDAEQNPVRFGPETPVRRGRGLHNSSAIDVARTLRYVTTSTVVTVVDRRGQVSARNTYGELR